MPADNVTRSSREPAQMQSSLEAWLRTQLHDAADPKVLSVEGTSANGMSSETLLLRTEWTEDGRRTEHPMVARVAPAGVDVPVFPQYLLDDQFEVIRQVGELTDVPVPKVWWYEPSPDVLGTPFFTMERLDGVVPPDVPPYTFGSNWLYDASPEDRRRMQDATVAVLAGIHGIDRPEERFAFLDKTPGSGLSPLRKVLEHTRDWYEWVAADFVRSPLIDATFAWLDENYPDDEGPTVLSWGDSRIGNIMYRDFAPVAVLDWEMACLGPPELDVSWVCYAHRVFEEITAVFELPGMPDFLRPADVCATYEQLTGYRCNDLEWFTMYGAVFFAIVFLRTGQRAIHFGEEEMPADIDDIIRNRAGIEQKLAGVPWND
jgi:aminoglycoside phosphotransferase (APT) family kinase protein